MSHGGESFHVIKVADAKGVRRRQDSCRNSIGLEPASSLPGCETSIHKTFLRLIDNEKLHAGRSDAFLMPFEKASYTDTARQMAQFSACLSKHLSSCRRRLGAVGLKWGCPLESECSKMATFRKILGKEHF